MLPCLDPKETVSKFEFKMLALVEKTKDEMEFDLKYARRYFSLYFLWVEGRGEWSHFIFVLSCIFSSIPEIN